MKYKERFLNRLVEMYGEDYAKKFYKERVKEEATDEMIKVATEPEDEGFDLNIM